jgi:periplasmic protein TonB
MSDPTRILDCGGTDADAVLKRALLGAARAHTPPPGAQRRLVDALGVDGGAVSADVPAGRRPRASDWQPQGAPGLLFASVHQRGSTLRRRLGPGALLSAGVHAAVFAVVILATSRVPSNRPIEEPRAMVQFRARLHPEGPTPPPRGAERGEAPEERQPEALVVPPSKGDRPPALVADGDRAGDPSAPALTGGSSGDTVAGAAPPEGLDAKAASTPDHDLAVAAPVHGGVPSSDVLPFGEGMSPPRLLEGPEPVYSREAREARVEGTMLVKCVITTAGALQGCRVIKPLPFLEKPVLDALALRRYTPVMFQGRPVNVEYVIPLRFELP